MEFTPSNFIKYLPYLLKGMLGTFIALGIIALSTIFLNKLLQKKKK